MGTLKVLSPQERCVGLPVEYDWGRGVSVDRYQTQVLELGGIKVTFTLVTGLT